MTQTTIPLPDGLLAEIRRCRLIREHAQALGVNGAFLVACLNHELRDAEEALASGDVLAMMRALTALKTYAE